MSKINGSNILITGAASGIGRLLSFHIVKEGGNLVLLDINKAGLEDLKQELLKTNKNVKIFIYKIDLSKKDEVLETTKKIKSDIGFIDIIVNNAGIVNGKSFIEADIDDIDKGFRINTMAHFWIIKSFIDLMIEKNRGHIVTISSAAGIIGVKKLSDYCASKFAVFGLTESLRMEFKKDNINIKTTIVSPFYIDTGMFKGVKTKVPWLLPILKPEKVALKIFKAIKKDKPLLLMPPIVKSVWFFRLFSVSFFDWIANFLGINNTMDEFKGRDK